MEISKRWLPNRSEALDAKTTRDTVEDNGLRQDNVTQVLPTSNLGAD